ncbi:hypothetical protein B1B_07766, partial [mine drainage metagenome]
SMEYIESILGSLRKITGDSAIVECAGKLSDVNAIFSRLRYAFKVPEKGSLSDNIADDAAINERCNILMEEMEVYLHENNT